MNAFYDLLSRNITNTEKIMFGNLSLCGFGCVYPTYVGGFSANFPITEEDLFKAVGITKEEVQIIDGFLGSRSNYLVHMFHAANDTHNQIKIIPFEEFIITNPVLMPTIISDNAMVNSRSISIVPYTKSAIANSERLRATIVYINHLIQIALAFGNVGVSLAMLIQTVLNTIFPNSHYVAEYETKRNKKVIEVSSGQVPLYDIEMTTEESINLNVDTKSPIFSRLTKIHKLQVLEITNAGLFIYLTCEIINSILSKQTIYEST